MLVTTLKKLISAYHWLVSPWLGSRCRFVPTCSDYAIQALDQHGVSRGLWLAVRRISHCHPWGGEGYDPVPPKVGQVKSGAASQNLLDRSPQNEQQNDKD